MPGGLLANLILQLEFAAETLLVHSAWPVLSTCAVLARFRHPESPSHCVINLTEGANTQDKPPMV